MVVDSGRPELNTPRPPHHAHPRRPRPRQPPDQPWSHVLVCSAHGARRNVMAAAWSMPVQFSPPRVAVEIDKSTFTCDLVRASGAFALCIPGRCICPPDLHGRQRECARVRRRGSACGQIHPVRHRHLRGPGAGLAIGGRLCGLARVPRDRRAPRAADLRHLVWRSGIGEADPRVFADGRWSFREDNAELHTLHHLGAGHFARPALRSRRGCCRSDEGPERRPALRLQRGCGRPGDPSRSGRGGVALSEGPQRVPAWGSARSGTPDVHRGRTGTPACCACLSVPARRAGTRTRVRPD